MSFATSSLLEAIASYFQPLVGFAPYNKKTVSDSETKALTCASILEKHLATSTYLVGERITIADYYVAGIISRGYQHVRSADFYKENMMSC